MSFRNLAVLTTALALPLALGQPLAAQAPEYAEQSWDASTGAPAEVGEVFPEIADSDLPFDTDYRVGVLDNGMRYVIRANATPPEQGLVYFWVDAGSVSEADGEEGYAHFIEHMAFNGSTNVPEGEMVHLLEREGLAFGADTNASTGFDTTLYRLDLPRNDRDLLDTALMLMRETASEITFDDEAVDREKGIILSERRVRDTYQLRNTIDNLEFFYPGSRFSRRMPIGAPESSQSIEVATGAALRALYERIYRPENTALVVVGDYDPEEVEAMIRDHFASWHGEPRLETPDFGPIDPDLAGLTDVFLDPAMAEAISISRHGEWLGEPDTAASRRARVLRQIGYSIVNRRLQRLARQDDPPFRSARLGTDEVFEVGRTTSLDVLTNEGEWQRGLAAAQEEYRRAVEFGFTEAEVAEQVANLRQAIESNAASAATRSNRNFLTGALTLLSDGQVPTTPASALERFSQHEPEITPETVLAALQADLVPLDNPLIRFSGSEPPEGGELALRSGWTEGMALALEAPVETAAAEFAYTDFGAPGTVVSDTVDDRLDIRTVRFANGLMLNLKRTDLQEERVLVQLNIDGGDLLSTADNPLATALVGSLPTGGLGAHTLDELQTVLAGRQVSFNVGSADETFRMSAATTPSDLELQLQLMTAALVDPGYRSTAEAQYRSNVQSFFDRLSATPSAALSNTIGGVISNGDPRFTLQSEEDYLALNFAKLRDDISDRWQNGAMELALVGDIDEDVAVALVAQTLGTLPAREDDFGTYEDARQRGFTDNREARTVYHDGQANQAMLMMIWPTRDDNDPAASMQLNMLERVTRLIMLEVIREELGQTYSPSVGVDLSRTYPGFGTFDVSAQVDTAQVDATRDAMLSALADLRDAPVDEDVLLRARQPLLEAIDNQLDSNGGWMSLVDRAQTERDRIDRFLSASEMVEAVTVGDVQALAVQYLDPAERLEFVVLPRDAGSETADDAAGD